MTTQQHHLPIAEDAVQEAAKEFAEASMPGVAPDDFPITSNGDMALQLSSRLNESDALLWNIERDPCLRSTIIAVSLLDGTPDWSSLRERIVTACRQVPRLRQKVVETPARVGPPRWQFDKHFDLDYHLRRVVVPPPGDLRAALDMAAPMAMAAFDKDRPLWEFTLVEGLDNGRSAFIQKVHHSFTDGVGGVELAQLLLDDMTDGTEKRTDAGSDVRTEAGTRHLSSTTSRRREAVSHARSAASVDVGRSGGLASVIDAVGANMRMTAAFSVRSATVLPALAATAVQHPSRLVRQTIRSVQSVAKLLAPVSTPMSTVMIRRGMSRRLEQFDVPLDALLAAAHAADSSLNDAFLASIAGGMRRYHEHHGVPVEGLRVTMPINLRRPDDPQGSNRFVPARLVIPVSTLDPAKRMRELGVLAAAWRREPSLSFSDVIAGVLNRLPIVATTSLFGGMLKAVDLVATNVPGIHQRVSLAGAEVIGEYAFAPTSGAALSIALLSHGTSCCIGVNVDTEAVDDPDVLVGCLVDGFTEVLAVAGQQVR